MSTEFRLKPYLTRIGFEGAEAPDLATLKALHACHVKAIPFESFDPLLGRPVQLGLGALQGKLVDSRRGGYCFEQNAVFKAALETIGFKVTGLAGRVRWMSHPDSPLGPKVHMLLKVDLPEGPHLADVGFGVCVLDTPLQFRTDIEQRTAMGTYRLTEEDGLTSLSAKRSTGWRTKYVFTLQPQIQSDYELGNWYTSTSPNGGWSFIKWPPQRLQNCRLLILVFMNLPRNSAPFVTLTFCGFHSVKAFTGDADHDRQDEQWQ